MIGTVHFVKISCFQLLGEVREQLRAESSLGRMESPPAILERRPIPPRGSRFLEVSEQARGL